MLERVGVSANPAIRLACQLRPQSDVSVIPILPTNMNANLLRKGRNINIGKERYIVSMFVDMRGSTRLAEKRLPFDVVFLINRFLGAHVASGRSMPAACRTSLSATACLRCSGSILIRKRRAARRCVRPQKLPPMWTT